jgi:rhodanese-related sulfurtransferase
MPPRSYQLREGVPAMSLPAEIEPAEAAAVLAETAAASCLLLDCRTSEEYATAKIERARLIPMQELPERLAEIEAWRDQRIIVHCHHGVRSLRVTNWLRERGFDQAQSLRGGIEAWSRDVDSAVPTY